MNRINTSEIPAVERRSLGGTFFKAIERFYSDPKNLRAFEEWKKSQEAKQCETGQ